MARKKGSNANQIIEKKERNNDSESNLFKRKKERKKEGKKERKKYLNMNKHVNI